MLLRGSEQSQARTLTLIGGAVVVVFAIAAAVIIGKPFSRPPDDEVSISMDMPYLGQGVIEGTALVMHGVQVGTVTGITSMPGGNIRVDAALQKVAVAGLTDTMQVDYRPINYFGVSGINVVQGTGGQALRNGMQLTVAPKGNFTLQAMLTSFGRLSDKVITPQLIHVIDWITRYTDGLDPLIETVFIATGALADVQRVSTAQLTTNTAGIVVTAPGLVNALSVAGDAVSHADNNWMHEGAGDLSDHQWYDTYGIPYLKAVTDGIFGSMGKLEASHVGDLLPLVTGVKALTDTVPPLMRPVGIGDTLAELRRRFEAMYGGTPEHRALQVRILLDSLPGVAAPVDALGGP